MTHYRKSICFNIIIYKWFSDIFKFHDVDEKLNAKFTQKWRLIADKCVIKLRISSETLDNLSTDTLRQNSSIN